MKTILETWAFHTIIAYLVPAEKTPSFEVLKGLESIVNGIARGDISAEHEEKMYFQVLFELYKTHFELSHSLEDTRNLDFSRQRYASEMVSSMVNLLMDYEKALTGEDLTPTRIDAKVKEDDITERDIIARAKPQFKRFKRYILRANDNGEVINMEAVDALNKIAQIYEQESERNEKLKPDYLFFTSLAKFAEHQLKLESLFEQIRGLDFSAQLAKYQFGKTILDVVTSTAWNYYHKFRA